MFWWVGGSEWLEPAILAQVLLLLFVAGAVLGEDQRSLFVAGAVVGEAEVSLFVAGAVLGLVICSTG